MEIFKESEKSLCHDCFNINEKCARVSKVCGTDSKIGRAFIERCSKFNKPITTISNYKNTSISVQAKRETRVEMMGGGHIDPENGVK